MVLELKLTTEKVGDNGKKFIVSRDPPSMEKSTLFIICCIVGILWLWIGVKKLKWLVTFIFLLTYFIRCFQIEQEIITILPSFGIEFKHILFSGIAINTKFIVWNDIDTIIINEGFTMFNVHYYLAILPKDKKELHLPFTTFVPRLDILLPIYKEIKFLIQKYKFNDYPLASKESKVDVATNLENDDNDINNENDGSCMIDEDVDDSKSD